MAGLDFEATLNTSNFDKGIDGVIDTIQKLSRRAKDSGVGLDEMLRIPNIDEFSAQLRGLDATQQETFKKLIESAKQTKEFMGTLTDPLSIAEYNKKLEDTRVKLNELLKQGSQVKQGGSLLGDLSPENVQIQKEAIEGMNDQIREMKAHLKADPHSELISKGDIANAEKEVAKATSTLHEMENALDQASGGNTKMATSSRTLFNRMIELENQGKRNTQEYKELSDQAAVLHTRRRQMTRSVQGESESLQTLMGSLNLVSGAYSTYMGISSMFISDQKKLQETQARLQSAISASVGIQQVSRQLTKEGIILSKIKAVQLRAEARAQALATKGTKGATIAQRAFNLVAKANPYVLLAMAIISVAGAFVLFSSKTTEAVKKMREANKEFGKGFASALGESVSSLNKLKREWDNLETKDRAKWVKNNASEFNRLGIEINSVSDAEKVISDNTGRFEEAMKARAKAEASYSLAKKYLIKQFEEEANAERFALEDIEERRTKAGRALSVFRVVAGGGSLNLFGESAISKKRASEEGAGIFKSLAEGFENQGEKYKADEKALLKVLGITSSDDKGGLLQDVSPFGSKAYWQKEVGKVTEALNKAVNQGDIDKLKERLRQVQIELEKASKRVSMEEDADRFIGLKKEIDERLDLWRNYYDAVRHLGEEKANEIYNQVIDLDTSQLDYLKDMREVVESGDLSDSNLVNYLKAINKQIDDLNGKTGSLDEFKEGLKIAMSGEGALAQIQMLEEAMEKLTEVELQSGKGAFLIEEQKRIRKNLRQNLESLMREQEGYEEKRLRIVEHYADLRYEATLSGTDEEVRAVNEAMKRALRELQEEVLRNSPDFAKVFTDMPIAAKKALQEVKAQFTKQLSEAKTAEEKIALGDFIRKIDEELVRRNPFGKILKAMKSLTDEATSFREKMKDVAEGANELGQAGSDLSQISQDVGEIIEAFGGDLDNEIGDALDKLDQIGQGLMQAAEGIEQFAQASASGNVIGMIAGGIKAVGGVIKTVGAIFNNDRKREREIKRWAEEVDELTRAYNRLEYAMKRALGDEVHKNRLQQIELLKEQQRILEQMIGREKKKKKTDSGRIKEFEDAIENAEQQINEIIDSISEDLFQTDVKGLADNLANALINAFEQGEDAAMAMDKVVDDMFKNMIRHALALKLQGPLNDFMNELLIEAGFDPETGEGELDFGAISEEAMNRFKENVGGLVESFGEFEGLFSDMFGDTIKSDTLEGQIKNITSQEANELVAQLNAVRINQGTSINTIANGVDELVGISLTLNNIEIHTSNLSAIKEQISDLNSKIQNDSMVDYSSSIN